MKAYDDATARAEAAAAEAAAAETTLSREGETQDETQAPGADAAGDDEIEMPPDDLGQAGTESAAQEANDAPDSGDAANLEGSEGLGQEQPSGEEPTIVPSDPEADPALIDRPGPFAPAAPVGAEEAPPLVEEPDEPGATEQVQPPDSEAAPIEGDASSRLIDGGGTLPTEELRDEAFSGEDEGEGAFDAAAPAGAGDAEIEMPLDPTSADAAHVDAAALDAADDAAEDAPSSIPEDQLLNPYEDDPSSIPEDELLNPYEDDPSSIPEDELLNPYEDDPVIDL
jgi:hypothetical protein